MLVVQGLPVFLFCQATCYLLQHLQTMFSNPWQTWKQNAHFLAQMHLDQISGPRCPFQTMLMVIAYAYQYDM